jgi:hypothetical protein
MGRVDGNTRNKYERMTELIFGSGRYGRLGRNIVTIELNKDFVEVAFPARIEVCCATSFVDDHS